MKFVRTVMAMVFLGLSSFTAISFAPASFAGAQTQSSCSKVEFLLMMDQSLSLQSTDSNNLRVQGAEELIRSLSDTAKASGEKINLAIGGFGNDAQIYMAEEFQLPENRTEAKTAVQRFANLNTDLNTDYILALRKSSEYFASKLGVPGKCKKLVWFTDGAYSIDNFSAPGLGTYSDSRDKRTLQSQLQAQVCGPLPMGSQLREPLSELIRQGGFSVQMIDLRAAGENSQDKAERAETEPVINRMFYSDIGDPCRINGTRVQADTADGLAKDFFREGQKALGHFELKCDLLNAGYPASMVNSLAVQNSNPSTKTRILLDGKAVGDEEEGFAGYYPKNGPTSAGKIEVDAGVGSLSLCFADLRATAVLQGNQSVFGKAKSSYLNIAVFGSGDDSPGGGVSDKFAVIDAKVGESPVSVEWNDASKSWRVKIDGPVSTPPELTVNSRAVDWAGPPFTRVTSGISVATEPPPPQVAWTGPVTIEGKKQVSGNLQVTPASLDTGGTLCVQLQQAKVEPTSLIVGVPLEEKCAKDDKPFTIPATLETTASENKTGKVELPFTATYTPEDSTPISLGSSENVIFSPIAMTKPLNAESVVIVTALFLLASVIFTMGGLLGVTNYQLRLPDPKKFRSVTLPVSVVDGALVRTNPESLRMEDYELVKGTRSSFDMGNGALVKRRFTANPFGAITARIRSKGSKVAARPAISKGFEKAANIPARFQELGAVNLDASGEAGVLSVVVPTGTKLENVNRFVDRFLGDLSLQLPRETSGPTLTSPDSDSSDGQTNAGNGSVGGVNDNAEKERSSSVSVRPAPPRPPVSPQSAIRPVSAPPRGPTKNPGDGAPQR